jgi:hypothetical protein
MFDQSVITGVAAPTYSGHQVFLSWTSTAAAGSVYQIYVDAVLSWSGSATKAWLPTPTDGVGRVDIGRVDADEQFTDFSASLDIPRRKIRLAWTGGTSLGATLVEFRVYGPAADTASIDFTRIAARVAAFPGGNPVASGSYSWTSPALPSGTYAYAVVPVDAAGNEGTRQFATEVLAVPPLPSAAAADGSRLGYQFHANGTTPTVTLSWLPSPG